jgi:hypothetical protein
LIPASITLRVPAMSPILTPATRGKNHAQAKSQWCEEI